MKSMDDSNLMVEIRPSRPMNVLVSGKITVSTPRGTLPPRRVSLVSALCVGFHVYAHNFLPGWFVGLAHLLFHHPAVFVRSFPM
jgi:hypothetical protein